MKVLTLTSTLLAALSLTVFAESGSALRSKISLKEKQLSEIRKELVELRAQLNTPTGQKYTVKTGDTFYSIARRHNVSVADIMKWNTLPDPTKMGIGNILIVSAFAPKTIQSTPSSTSESSGYLVVKGDTFYSISRRHQMTVAQLRTLNPEVSTHLIAPGQTISVSGKAAPTPAPLIKKEVRKTTSTVKVSKKADKPAPEKISTATTLAKKIGDPAPVKETVATVIKKESTPVSTPPAPPVVEDPKPASSVASVILTDVTTFDAFARKHGTNTTQLNALNGWNMPKATLLARGSEIFVPK
jgi:LysM repeat protein